MKRTYAPKAKELKVGWYFIDAENKILGQVATEAAKVLMGKTKANYTPNINTGDKVVITNAEKIAVTGKKLTDKIYTHYTGFPKGLREISLGEVLKKRPTDVLKMAISGMLPKNKLRDVRINNLYIYVGPEHPHKGQAPKAAR